MKVEIILFGIAIIIINSLISVGIGYINFEALLDHYHKHVQQTIVNKIMIKGILENKDKKESLRYFNKINKRIEEKADV